MKRNSHKEEQGNAIFEMIPFLPLLLFLLFTGLDGGLAVTERAALQDAVRSGVNIESLVSSNAALLSLGEELQVSTNEENIYKMLDNVHSEIFENLLRAQRYNEDETPNSFAITLAAVQLEFDSTTGAYQKTFITELLSPTKISHFSLENVIPSFSRESIATYVATELSDNISVPSPYALPIGFFYERGDKVTQQFLEISSFLYISVEALPRGLHSKLTHNSSSRSPFGLEQPYFLYEQFLIPLREGLQ